MDAASTAAAAELFAVSKLSFQRLAAEEELVPADDGNDSDLGLVRFSGASGSDAGGGDGDCELFSVGGMYFIQDEERWPISCGEKSFVSILGSFSLIPKR